MILTFHALVTQIDPTKWQLSQLHDSSLVLEWIPVAKLGAKGLSVGIAREGYFVLESRSGLALLGAPQNLLFLLPCLENDQNQIKGELERGLAGAGLPVEIAEYFPLDDLVLYGLGTHSDYWAGLALTWQEQMPLTVDGRVALADLMTHKRVSQKTRHRARKIFSRQTK